METQTFLSITNEYIGNSRQKEGKPGNYTPTCILINMTAYIPIPYELILKMSKKIHTYKKIAIPYAPTQKYIPFIYQSYIERYLDI